MNGANRTTIPKPGRSANTGGNIAVNDSGTGNAKAGSAAGHQAASSTSSIDNNSSRDNSAYWSTQNSNASSTPSTSYPASSNGYVPTGNIQRVDQNEVRRAEAAREMKQIQDDYADLKQGEKQIGSTLDKFVVNGTSIGKHTYRGEAAAAHSKVTLPTDTGEYTKAINDVADDIDKTEELMQKVADFDVKYGDLDIDKSELGGIHKELGKKVEEAQDVMDDLKGTRDKIDEINQRQANLFGGSKKVDTKITVSGDRSKINLNNSNQAAHFGSTGKENPTIGGDKEGKNENTYTVTFPDGSKVTVDSLEKANAAIAAEGGLGSVYYNGTDGNSTHVADGGGGTGKLNFGSNPTMSDAPTDEYFQNDLSRYYAQERGRKQTDYYTSENSSNGYVSVADFNKNEREKLNGTKTSTDTRNQVSENTYTVAFPDGSKVTVASLTEAQKAIAAEGGLGSIYFNGEDGNSTHVADGSGASGKINMNIGVDGLNVLANEYFANDYSDYYTNEMTWQIKQLPIEELDELLGEYRDEIAELKTEYEDTQALYRELEETSKRNDIDALIKRYNRGMISEEVYEQAKANFINWLGEDAFKESEDRVAKLAEYEETSSELLKTIASKEDFKQFFLMTECDKLTKNDDFEALSKGRIATCDIEYESGWGGEQKKYVFYDEEGNVIDNPSDIEIAEYFNSSEDAKSKLDNYDMTESVKAYYDAFQYLDQKHIDIISYLANTGDTEKLAEYSEYAMNLATAVEGKEKSDELTKKIDEFYDRIGTNTAGTKFLQGEPTEFREYTEDDAFVDTMKFLFGEGYKTGLKNVIDNISNIINADGKMSAEEYKNVYLLQYLNEKYGDTLEQELTSGSFELGTNIGNMTPSVLLSSVTGMPQVGLALLGASSYGGSYEEGLQLGLSQSEAREYAAKNALSEVGLQYLLGGISSLGSGELAKTISELTGVNKFIAEIGSEIVEENVQAILNPYLLSEASHGKIAYDGPTVKDVLKTTILTAISTAMLNTGSLVIDGTRYTLAADAAKKLNNVDFSNPDLGTEIINKEVLVKKQDERNQLDTSNNVFSMDNLQLLFGNDADFSMAIKTKLSLDDIKDLSSYAVSLMSSQQALSSEQKSSRNKFFSSIYEIISKSIGGLNLANNISMEEIYGFYDTKRDLFDIKGFSKYLNENNYLSSDKIIKYNDSDFLTFEELNKEIGSMTVKLGNGLNCAFSYDEKGKKIVKIIPCDIPNNKYIKIDSENLGSLKVNYLHKDGSVTTLDYDSVKYENGIIYRGINGNDLFVPVMRSPSVTLSSESLAETSSSESSSETSSKTSDELTLSDEITIKLKPNYYIPGGTELTNIKVIAVGGTKVGNSSIIEDGTGFEKILLTDERKKFRDASLYKDLFKAEGVVMKCEGIVNIENSSFKGEACVHFIMDEYGNCWDFKLKSSTV